MRVDFRLISATNRSLIDLVKAGKFREDLYYRLNVFPIRVPPLRERRDDIPVLVRHFTARFAAEEGKSFIRGVTAPALQLLSRYNWPGNIRQLENAVFRAVVLADEPMLTPEEFPQIAAHVDGAKWAEDAVEAPTPAAPADATFDAAGMPASRRSNWTSAWRPPPSSPRAAPPSRPHPRRPRTIALRGGCQAGAGDGTGRGAARTLARPPRTIATTAVAPKSAGRPTPASCSGPEPKAAIPYPIW